MNGKRPACSQGAAATSPAAEWPAQPGPVRASAQGQTAPACVPGQKDGPAGDMSWNAPRSLRGRTTAGTGAGASGASRARCGCASLRAGDAQRSRGDVHAVRRQQGLNQLSSLLLMHVGRPQAPAMRQQARCDSPAAPRGARQPAPSSAPPWLLSTWHPSARSLQLHAPARGRHERLLACLRREAGPTHAGQRRVQHAGQGGGLEQRHQWQREVVQLRRAGRSEETDQRDGSAPIAVA